MAKKLAGVLVGVTLWAWYPLAWSAEQGQSKKKEARAVFLQGQKHYRLGRFQQALEAYSKAYDILPLPGLLFNIGQCHRKLGNYERAVFFFRGYLREVPGAKNRPVVEKLLAECEGKLAEQRRLEQQKKAEEEKAAELARRQEEERRRAEQELAIERARLQAAEATARAVASQVAEQQQTSPIYRTWWFWTIVGVAVAGAAAGTYFAVRPAPGAVNPSGSLGTVVW